MIRYMPCCSLVSLEVDLVILFLCGEIYMRFEFVHKSGMFSVGLLQQYRLYYYNRRKTDTYW